jgi:endoglucanase
MTNQKLQNIISLLEKFSNAHGISGYESEVREIFKEEISPFVDEIKIDKMGNLIAIKKGGKPSVMIASHMDEIGLMAKYIDDRGYIYFVTVGGFSDQTLLSQRVIVHTKKGNLIGVIGSKPPHIMEAEEQKKVIQAKNMFIDIGAKNKKDAEKLGVEIGSPITIDRKFEILENNLVTGKALDNRAGLVMLIEAMKRISRTKTKNLPTIYAVGTVQEEVGLKGAHTSAFEINPDVAIATDVNIPGDYPGVEKKDSEIELGKGASITVMEASGRGVIVQEKVLEWLKETAKKNKIKYQLDVGRGGMTDATAIHLTKSGIPTGVISAPTRYIHSPVEVLNINDLDEGAELIAKSVISAGKYF